MNNWKKGINDFLKRVQGKIPSQSQQEAIKRSSQAFFNRHSKTVSDYNQKMNKQSSFWFTKFRNSSPHAQKLSSSVQDLVKKASQKARYYSYKAQSGVKYEEIKRNSEKYNRKSEDFSKKDEKGDKWEKFRDEEITKRVERVLEKPVNFVVKSSRKIKKMARVPFGKLSDKLEEIGNIPSHIRTTRNSVVSQYKAKREKLWAFRVRTIERMKRVKRMPGEFVRSRARRLVRYVALVLLSVAFFYGLIKSLPEAIPRYQLEKSQIEAKNNSSA